MRKLEPGDPLKVGDVVMVHDKFTIRETGQEKPWKWLGIVMMCARRNYTVIAHRVGTREGVKSTRIVQLQRMPTYLLTEDEWPDGVWQERTRLIMEGVIDI